MLERGIVWKQIAPFVACATRLSTIRHITHIKGYTMGIIVVHHIDIKARFIFITGFNSPAICGRVILLARFRAIHILVTIAYGHVIHILVTIAYEHAIHIILGT
jgi:hypothetical protein